MRPYPSGLGEAASSQASRAEAISLAKELNDMSSLAFALYLGGILACFERHPAEVERLVSDLIELSTRYNFAFWLPGANVLRGWARSVSGDMADGIVWIEQGIEDYRATGSVAALPMWLALKAEALHLADRTSEALEAIREAELQARRFELGSWYAELHRLRAVFLAAMGADEIQIEASSHQNNEAAERRVTNETDRSNLRGIPRPKNRRVRWAWVQTISWMTYQVRRFALKGERS